MAEGAFRAPMTSAPAPVRRRVRCVPLFFAALLAAAPAFAAKGPDWKPVTPQELAESAPLLEKEVPAEALFNLIEIDDRGFPAERRMTQYVRYKIFAPDKVEHITRISATDGASATDRIDLRARLTLPDGRTQEFGAEAIKERTLAKSGSEGGFLGWLSGGGPEVKEKFLAIGGIEAGAVLEYRISRRVVPPRVTWFSGQIEGIPVRQFTYVCRPLRDPDTWDARTFVRNTQTAKLTEDRKTGTVTVTATNLPAIVPEPFVGPATDYALTIFNCYELLHAGLIPRSGKIPYPGTIDPKLGPWAPYATLMNWVERDRGVPTPRVKALAKELTAGLVEPAAKARAIHVHVQNLYQKHRRRAGPRPAERVQPDNLDDILDVDSKPEVIRFAPEFVWLAIALYREAGLECQAVLLPSRALTRFNPDHVSGVFLADEAVALRLGGEWTFSNPQSVNRQPFGLLPWENEGQVGLLARDKKQEFIRIPTTDPERSTIATTGKFAIDAEGTLTGECTRTFTGQTAVALRGELRKNQKTARERIAAGKLGVDPNVVEVKMTKIDALDDAEKPLLLTATLRWPGFATRMKDRLMVRPAVLRADASSPFTASERRHPVHFPYRWRENDRLEIVVPEGFAPEAPTAPAPSPGQVLQCETKLSYDPSNRTLHVTREFVSNLLDLPAERYPALKAWYDRVRNADQHEVVFGRKGVASAAKED